MNTVIWTPQFPTEPGWYWFYGYPEGRYGLLPENVHPELLPVNVKMAGGAGGNPFPIYIANGTFIYKTEASECQFTPMIVPELPE